jgi:hypothetical protein
MSILTLFLTRRREGAAEDNEAAGPFSGFALRRRAAA